MTINVRFFASLREQLGSGETELDFQPALTVKDVWNLSTHQRSLPANVLVAVNQEYVSFNESVHDGDEVAFFPPVTGG
jgi:molybdopterin synthase sulfur carrier subunit